MMLNRYFFFSPFLPAFLSKLPPFYRNHAAFRHKSWLKTFTHGRRFASFSHRRIRFNSVRRTKTVAKHRNSSLSQPPPLYVVPWLKLSELWAGNLSLPLIFFASLSSPSTSYPRYRHHSRLTFGDGLSRIPRYLSLRWVRVFLFHRFRIFRTTP